MKGLGHRDVGATLVVARFARPVAGHGATTRVAPTAGNPILSHWLKRVTRMIRVPQGTTRVRAKKKNNICVENCPGLGDFIIDALAEARTAKVDLPTTD